MGLAINNLAPASEDRVSGGKIINQSLRFDGSSYLSRTPGSAGNRRTSTFSVWFKWVASGGEGVFLWANGRTKLSIDPGGNDRVQLDDYSGSYNLQKQISQSLRDPSAWYHIVIVFDTTNATAEDRNKLYLNGERITDFETSTNPSQNFDTDWNNSVEHRLGADNNPFYFRGYMAECHMIDGTALDPSYFGFTDPLTNTWRPKKVEDVTYGTNGFYLDFSDSSDIGADRSGNGNDFSTTGLVAADVVPDSPSGVSFGTAPTSDYTASIQQKPTNWATLNPIEVYNGRYSNAPTNGNLEVSIPSDSVQKRNYPGFYSTLAIPTTGKFYFEFEPSQQYTTINIVDVDEVNTITSGDHVGASDKLSFQYFCESGNYRFNGTVTASGLGGYTSGNIYGAEVDLGNKTFQVYENGIAGSVLSISTAGGTYAGSEARVAPSIDSSGASGTVKMNFGQLDFVNPPGTIGSTEYFNTVLYTGNGSTQSVSGVGFQPDLVVAKNRDSVNDFRVLDVVRGVGEQIYCSNANQEETVSTGLTSFDSDGFSLGSSGAINGSGIDFCAWCWKAGGTASSNTDGTLTSSVSVNNDAGFSISTYRGAGGTSDFGHGLDSAPDVVIIKNRTDNSTNWNVFHTSMGNTKYINLNNANSSGTTSNMWNDTSPTDSVVHIGSDNTTSGKDFVAYCWTEKAGLSKFGEYTGNGSSDGPVISCGFRPAMVIIKWYADINSSESWQLYDNKRAGNPTNTILQPDSSGAEESPSDRFIQFTEDGFQLKSNGQQINRDGAKYIFMAWAATFTPDNDYKVLASANLTKPTSPAAVRPDKYFGTITYDGSSDSTLTLSSLNFKPDLVWVKSRTNGSGGGTPGHIVTDSVRGAGTAFFPNNSAAQDTNSAAGYLSDFSSNGFTLSDGSSSGQRVKYSTNTYVAWCWKAGGNSSTFNIDGVGYATTVAAGLDGGDISPTGASINTESGFSIITYTGDSVNGTRTISHGLGKKPELIIIRNQNSTNSGGEWITGHKGLASDAFANNKFLKLDVPNNTFTNSLVFGAEPTTTLIQITSDGDGGATNIMDDGNPFIIYSWCSIPGFSKIGSFTGNNNANGPFVHCGFRPAWILFKNANDNLAGWHIFDTSRSDASGANPLDRALFPNSSAQEEAPSGTSSYVDALSNGFKIRSATGSVNGSGNTIIFAAFAESPTNNLYGGQANAR